MKIPRIGVVRAKEPTSALLGKIETGAARILSATISQESGRWFVSFGCEVERSDRPATHPEAVVGVDLGVHHLAAISTGKYVDNPKALNRYRRRMARLQRQLSRKPKGSKRRMQTTAKLTRCHRRVANIRNDPIHKVTSHLASTYATVVVEDLNVSGMTAAPAPKVDDKGTFGRNGAAVKAGLNRSVLDTSPATFRRQLTYKLHWHHGRLIVADRFFPSSKTCSSCGEVKAKLSASTRSYRCENCGLEADRGLNAAMNLAAYGRRVLDVAVSGTETQNARGGGHPRQKPKPPVKREDGSGRPDRSVTVSSQGEAA